MGVDVQGDGAAAGFGQLDGGLDSRLGPGVRHFAGAVGFDGDGKAAGGSVARKGKVAPDRPRGDAIHLQVIADIVQTVFPGDGDRRQLDFHLLTAHLLQLFPPEFPPVLRLVESGPEVFRRDDGSHRGGILRIGGIREAEHQRGGLVISSAEHLAFPSGKQSLPGLFEVAVLIDFDDGGCFFADFRVDFDGVTFGIHAFKPLVEGETYVFQKTLPVGCPQRKKGENKAEGAFHIPQR